MLESINIFLIGHQSSTLMAITFCFLISLGRPINIDRKDGEGAIFAVLFVLLIVGCLSADVSVLNKSNQMPFLVLNKDRTVSVFIYKSVMSKDRDLDGSISEDIQKTSYLIRCSIKGKEVSLGDCWKRIKNKSESELIAMGELTSESELVSR